MKISSIDIQTETCIILLQGRHYFSNKTFGILMAWHQCTSSWLTVGSTRFGPCVLYWCNNRVVVWHFSEKMKWKWYFEDKCIHLLLWSHFKALFFRGGGGKGVTPIETCSPCATAKMHRKGIFFTVTRHTCVSCLGYQKQEKSEKKGSKIDMVNTQKG